MNAQIAVAPRNLVSMEAASRAYAGEAVLAGVSLGVAAGDRIGVVGRNGGGKSTLLRLLARRRRAGRGRGHAHRRPPRRAAGAGRRPRSGADRPAGRGGRYGRSRVGRRSAHPRRAGGASRQRRRGPVRGRPRHADRAAVRRRATPDRAGAPAARASDLLLLDEPTNHLDVEGVDWLARHLAARPAVVVVTHDRWFLDAVCTRTWEVTDGAVQQYDGGYAAWILAARRARPDRRGHRGAAPEPRPQGARLAAAGAAGADVEAAVPDRGGERADRGRAARPQHRRAAPVRDRPARPLRRRPRGRRRRVRRAPAAAPGDVAARAGRPGRPGGRERLREDDAAARAARTARRRIAARRGSAPPSGRRC